MLVSATPNQIPEGSSCALSRHPHTNFEIGVIVDIGNFKFFMIFLTLSNFYFNGPLVLFQSSRGLTLNHECITSFYNGIVCVSSPVGGI